MPASLHEKARSIESPMTRTLLVAGTASHVGKSTVVAGLCRALADEGVNVAPYKAQNMSNNARVALTPDGEWGEIGISQWVQAKAAGLVPRTDHNPVLLKPRGDGQSQLVVQGEAQAHQDARSYYEEHWEEARAAAIESFDRLASHHDILVAEGAGSIAEINLHDRDLANVETARFGDADILLLVDIERGGAFASLYGTVELLPEGLRDRIVGAAITKFRGDESLLADGIDEIEAKTDVPIVGVLPYDDPGLPEEDSVSLEARDDAVFGEGDGVSPANAVTIAVPRLPRISNFTDLEPLAREPGVRVAYVDLEDGLRDADAVVLPGSKNTVDDLLALRDAGFDDALRSFGGPVVGLCGGYQMLGECITNAHVESTQDRSTVDGIGLLPVETVFSQEKTVERVTVQVEGAGPIDGATGRVTGYEIHMGDTEPTASLEQPLGANSGGTDRVLGTYLHGLFENATIRNAFLEQVFATADRQRPPKARHSRQSPFEHAGTLVQENLDFAQLGLPH